MTISSEMRDRIQGLIDKIIHSPDTPQEKKRLSSERNALQVSTEWTGFYFLTPDGEILLFDSDAQLWKTESDPMWMLHAIVQGSQRSDFLRALIPEKPASAIECIQCKGIGNVMIGNIQAGCGKCLKLGWLQSDGSGPWNAA